MTWNEMPTALIIAIAVSMLVAILPSAARNIKGKANDHDQEKKD
jgi:hypothetical protein